METNPFAGKFRVTLYAGSSVRGNFGWAERSVKVVDKATEAIDLLGTPFPKGVTNGSVDQFNATGRGAFLVAKRKRMESIKITKRGFEAIKAEKA